MSTKIYHGYRLLLSRVNEFRDWYRKECFKRAVDEIKMMMKSLTDKSLEEYCQEKALDSKLSVDEFKEKWGIDSIKATMVFGWYIEGSKRQERAFNCDCFFNMWIKGKYAYVIPGFPAQAFDFPDWCEDYCYFNNTDLPEGMTDQEWKRREKTWNSLCLDDWDENRFSHTVINLSESTSPGARDIEIGIFGKDFLKGKIFSPFYVAHWNFMTSERQKKKISEGKVE